MGFGGLMLAIAPRNLLHLDATASAMDTPHPVQKENQDSPEGDELEAPLGQTIGTRRRPVDPEQTAAVPCAASAHLDGLLAAL